MRLSRLFFPFLCVFFLVGIFIASLPTLVSSDWGRRQALKWINYSIPGQLEIRSLKLQWSQGQKIEGLLLKDPEGQQVLGMEYFSTETPLWQLIRDRLPLGFSQIKDLNLVLVIDENGKSNLQRALGTSSHSSLSLPALSPSPISLSDVYADLSLFSQNQPFSAHIEGKTHQENLSGSFDLSLSLPSLHASNWEELKKEAERSFSIEGGKEGEMRARIVNFPIDLIDRLAALQVPPLTGFFRSLLGDRLNVTIDKENDLQGLGFQLTATTPFMQGKMKGKMTKEHFLLQEPSLFQLHLIPDSINSWIQQGELLKPAQIKISLSTLAFPLDFLSPNGNIDPSQIDFQAKIEAPEIEMDLETFGIWKLSKCIAELKAPFSQPDMRAEIGGEAKGKEEPFTFSFALHEKKPRNLYAFFDSFEQPGKEAALSLTAFPLSLLPFGESIPLLTEAIGSPLDLEIKLKSHKKEEWLATMSAKTNQFAFKDLPFKIGKEIRLSAPGEIKFLLSPKYLSSLSLGKLLLKEPSEIQIFLNHLHIPLEKLEATEFNMEVALQSAELSQALVGETLHIHPLHLHIEGQTLQHFSSLLKGEVTLLSRENSPSSLVDAPLQLEQIANWKIHPNKSIEMTAGTLQLSNADHLIQIEGKLSPERVFSWTQPITMNYTLTSQGFLQLVQYLKLEEPFPQLREPSRIQLTIDPDSLPLSSLSLSSLHMKGLLTVDHLALQDPSKTLPYLKQLSLPWAINGVSNTLSAHFKGTAYTDMNNKMKSSPLIAYLMIGDWIKEGSIDFRQSMIEAKLNLRGLPISLLNLCTNKVFKQAVFTSSVTDSVRRDAADGQSPPTESVTEEVNTAFKQTPDWSLVLGPFLDIDLKAFIDFSWKRAGYWDMYLDSTYFHLRNQVKLDQVLTFHGTEKPSELRLTLTPESYDYLKNFFSLSHEGKLAAPITLAAYLSNLYIPLREMGSNQRRFDIQFSTNDIQWQEDKSSPTKLQGQIGSQDLNESIHVSLQAKSSSSLSLQGVVSHVFDERGQVLPWRENGWDIKVMGQKLTPLFLKNLFLLDEETALKLAALFGESLDIQLTTQLRDITGPLQAIVKGVKGEATLDGELKKGVLTLHSPLKGDFQLTPAFTQAFLTKNFPLLRSAVGGESAIRFQVESDQFSFPLVPFAWNLATIPKAVLDVGKIYFRNEGELKSLFSFLPSLSGDLLSIWFTPLYLELNQGLLNVKRIDLLVGDTYPLASWGKVDLNRHRGDFILGLSARALHSAFGVQGLDQESFLQIPIRTVDGQVEMDKKRATARLSALIAQTQGGSKGKLLGHLLEIVAAEEGEQGGIPPSTTSPLPWRDQFVSPVLSENEKEEKKEREDFGAAAMTSKAEKKKKKKRSYQELDLLKGMEEGATKVLDRLLR